ncbi:MAG: hypothetical protein ACFFBH_12540 [Promethearchaeota archaeon]
MSKFHKCLSKTQKLNSDVYNSDIRDSIHNHLYPCDLGVFFFDSESYNFFEILKREINTNFDQYFYKIKKEVIENDFISKTKVKEILKLRKAHVYPTTCFYEKISELKLRNNFKIGVGITDVPIYSSSKNNLIFLYGEAHLYLNSAIVSSYNLKSQDITSRSYNERLQKRIIKEVIHEVGHFILGPNHCENKLCIMSFSKNIWDVDKKCPCFCKECKVELEKIKDSFTA